MPDVDPLALAIRFALTHKPIGRDARRLIRSLPDHQLEVLCEQVAARTFGNADGGSYRPIRQRRAISFRPGRARGSAERVAASEKLAERVEDVKNMALPRFATGQGHAQPPGEHTPDALTVIWKPLKSANASGGAALPMQLTVTV